MSKITQKIKEMSSENKNIWLPLYFFVLVTLGSLTFYLGTLAYYSISSSDLYSPGAITVTGHGEVDVLPDIRTLSVNINKVDTGTTTLAQKVMSYLKKQGISDKDISIKSAESITVKLRGKNMDNADEIAAGLNKLSSKNVYAVANNPEIENPTMARARALDMALSDAKASAMKVSRSLNVQLGKLTSYYDQNVSNNYSAPDANTIDNVVDPTQPIKVLVDVSLAFQVK